MNSPIAHHAPCLMTERRKPSVLVVDDELDACQNLADILSDFDYEVDTACCGEDALRLVRQKSYDVALLDLKMPGMDGVTLYRHVRRIRPSTVALVVTAYASGPATDEALDAGAWQVLTKPVEVANLLPLVDEIIHQPLVLIVDDDAALCDSLWDILRERKLRVAVAHSASEAFEALAGEKYQVVLIDVKLPDRDGRHILRKLNESRSETRRILITGHPEEFGDVLISAQKAGADAVCYKPLDLKLLLGTIDRLAYDERRGG